MESVLERARFRGDIESLAALHADETVASLLDRVKGHVGHYNARRYLLADAVRVDPKVLPDLHHALDDVASRARLELPLETYVHAGGEINAAVTTSKDRIIVILSSGAVERLAAEELDFVIGHELGHAVFRHLDVPVRTVLETHGAEVKQKQAMQMLHWHRCAEVSADRAGLVCCGSLESAARTMFKVLSGLNLEELRIAPHELAEQWTDLADEVRNNPKGDHWLAPHPFPPLRMKALIAFWGSETGKALIPDAAGGAPDGEADRSIDRWLSLMNPLARDSVESGSMDPLLIGFVLWAALHVSSSNESMKHLRIARLEAMIGSDSVDRALSDVPSHGYRERFLLARSERARPLSALELHRIFSSIAQILKADGSVHPEEIRAMKELALECRVQENVIDKLL
jgi:hypothetical protein